MLEYFRCQVIGGIHFPSASTYICPYCQNYAMHLPCLQSYAEIVSFVAIQATKKTGRSMTAMKIYSSVLP